MAAGDLGSTRRTGGAPSRAAGRGASTGAVLPGSVEPRRAVGRCRSAIGAATAPGATRIGGALSREPDGCAMNGACGEAIARPLPRMGSGGGAP